MIDDAFARTYFADTDPIGKRLHIDDYDFEPAEIVGVVGHVKQWGLDQDETTAVGAQLYQPFLQMPDPQVSATRTNAAALAITKRWIARPSLRRGKISASTRPEVTAWRASYHCGVRAN